MDLSELPEPTWESLPLSHFSLSLSPPRPTPKPPISPTPNLSSPCADLNAPLSIDSVLPDDIIERILSFLPVRTLIRASATCTRWRAIVRVGRRALFGGRRGEGQPWYFMFTQNESAGGLAYDPVVRKWFSFPLPCVQKSTWLVSSSRGLVCFLDTDSFTRILISNPLSPSHFTELPEPSKTLNPDYSTVSISLSPSSLSYTVSLTRSKQISQENFHQWGIEIHLYGSERKKWARPVSAVLDGWRGGDDSVICDNNLFVLIQSTGVTANSVPRHRILIYDMVKNYDNGGFDFLGNSVGVPCGLTCGRLMNLKDKMILVGGIAKNDRPDIIKGIGIWELVQKEGEKCEWGWREITKMPHKYFQGFGEFDDVFASSGAEGLVYVQSYGSTMLLVFDVEKREWRWAAKCPVSKRFPLQLFTGFCFEPRLEVGGLV